MKWLIGILVLCLAGVGSAEAYSMRGNWSYNSPMRTASISIVATPQQLAAAPSTLLPEGVSAYAIDTASSTTLYSQNAGTQRPIASITKLMTAYLLLSHHDLNETVTVKDLPTYGTEDETLGLYNGETFKLVDLVRAALIPSDNDAADALAIYDAGSTTAFIAKMNATLKQWGISNAHYASASGLNDDDNYASAEALAHIAQLALTNKTLSQLVATPSATIKDGNGAMFSLTSTNELLADGQFYGIKTGYTTAAGQCFVGLTTINGHEVMTIVLGSADRFGDTITLRNWIQGAWTWQ